MSTPAARYGKPDRVDSTEYDSPRPLIVTRLLDYKSERVRFVFFPDAPVGSGPPYTTWKLMGMLDTKTKTTLTAAEVERRMSGRLMKKP